MAQHPENECSRLKALQTLGVLDTPQEPEFDGLVQAAALICDVPISLISLIDSDRQWFKANVGLSGVTQTPREVAFCSHTILEDGLLEVGDATLDSRFSNNPLVTGSPEIRFYAGVTLRLSDGSNVGSLCVIDRVARELTEKQRAILQHLSNAAVNALEARMTSNKLAVSQARFQALSESSPLGVFSADANGACTYTNDQLQKIIGMEPEKAFGHGWTQTLHPDDKEAVFAEWQRSASCRHNFDMQFRIVHDTGSVRHVRTISRPVLSDSGGILGHIGSVEDVSDRQQTQHELHEERQRLGFIIEGVGAGTWEWNVQTDECRVNKRWGELLGLSPNDLDRPPLEIWRERIHPSDAVCTDELLDAHFNGDLDIFEIETRVRNQNGDWIWLVECGQVMTRTADDKPEWMFGTLQDITLRKTQEMALRHSEVLLKQTGKLANVGGCELDIETGVLQWSDQYCRLHGLEPGYQPDVREAIGFYVPEHQPIIRKAVQNAMSDGQSWDLELRLVQISGQVIWVRIVGYAEMVNGEPVRVRGAMHDITEQVLHRQALENAREKIALATESGEIGVWEWDLENGAVTWTERMFALFGLPLGPSEVSYEQWINRLHPEDQESCAAVVQNAIDNSDRLDTEYRVVWPDGSVRHLRASAHINRDESGAAIKMLGVNWDVTPLRQLSSDLAAQGEMLRVTLESIGDAVITTDASGKVTWQNPVAEKMTGWASDGAIGRPLNQVFHIVNEDTRQQAINPVLTCLKHGKVVGLANHTVLISRDGSEYGIEDSAAPIMGRNGEQLGAVLVFHDVTEQRRLSNEMSYRATHDALTGLLNRAEFETLLRRKLLESEEDCNEHSLLYIDLDQFKLVNDACGHSVGDQLLVKMAKLLENTVRHGDILARLGGDEFGIILQRCSNEEANLVAQQICTRMDEFRFEHDGRRFRIGTSIGLRLMK